MAKERRLRQSGLREQLAYRAARLMAEDGIQDYGTAKRKAARQAGVPDTQQLPGNDEIEAALRAYQALYQSNEQPRVLQRLRQIALTTMQMLSAFRPRLVGSVLDGTAGAHSEVNLQVFANSEKDVELFLLNRGIRYQAATRRIRLGDRNNEVPHLTLTVDGVEITLAVFGSNDERIARRANGRALEHGDLAEVKALVDQG